MAVGGGIVEEVSDIFLMRGGGVFIVGGVHRGGL